MGEAVAATAINSDEENTHGPIKQRTSFADLSVVNFSSKPLLTNGVHEHDAHVRSLCLAG